MVDVPEHPDGTDKPTEREKWRAEETRKNDELALRRREVELREKDATLARLSNPLFLAVIGAFLAALTNIWVTAETSKQQREMETLRSQSTQAIEKNKAESQLVLEVIKTADPVKAAANLSFLTSTNLIKDKDVKDGIEAYLKKTPPEKGISLPVPTGGPHSSDRSLPGVSCVIRGSTDLAAAKNALINDPKARRTTWSRETATEAYGSTEFESEGITGSLEHLLRVEGNDIRLRATLQTSGGFLISLFGDSLMNSTLRNTTISIFKKVGKAVVCDQ